MTAPQPPIPTTACPSCGALFIWKANLAGRKLKCHCGALMRMPSDPDGRATLEQPTAPTQDETEDSESLPVLELDPDSGEYELELSKPGKNPLPIPAAPVEPAPAEDLLAPPIQPSGRCPSCGSPIKLRAAICLNCGLHLTEGKSIQTEVGIEVEAPPIVPTRPTETEIARLTDMVARVVRERKRLDELDVKAQKQYRFQEFYLPLIMLAGGVVAVIIGGIRFSSSWPMGLLVAAGLMAMEVFIMMPLLLLAVFIAARIGGIGFGPLPTAVLKLAAICIGPGTVADLLMIPIMAILMMTMAGFFVVFGIYLLFLGLPMARLFDLDMHEASITVGIAIIIRSVALILGASVVWGMFHP